MSTHFCNWRNTEIVGFTASCFAHKVMDSTGTVPISYQYAMFICLNRIRIELHNAHFDFHLPYSILQSWGKEIIFLVLFITNFAKLDMNMTEDTEWHDFCVYIYIYIYILPHMYIYYIHIKFNIPIVVWCENVCQCTSKRLMNRVKQRIRCHNIRYQDPFLCKFQICAMVSNEICMNCKQIFIATYSQLLILFVNRVLPNP